MYIHPHQINTTSLSQVRQPPRFSSNGKFGKTADNPRFADIAAQVETALMRLERAKLQDSHIVIRDMYADFFLNDDTIGLPPTLEATTYKLGKLLNKKDTNKALALIGLEVLNQLPPASSGSEALAQFETALEKTSDSSWTKTQRLIIDRSLNCPEKLRASRYSVTICSSNGLSAKGSPLAGCENKMTASLFRRHIAFIAPNGAIQVVNLPSPKQLADMIRNDHQAQKSLDIIQPLTQDKHRVPKLNPHGVDAQATLRHLDEISQGKHPRRESNLGWNDIHSILSTIPLDLLAHAKAGRFTILFNKCSSDGRTVWQALNCDPVPQMVLQLPAPKPLQGEPGKNA